LREATFVAGNVRTTTDDKIRISDIMGLFGNLFGTSGSSKVSRKMKADEDSRKRIDETQKREEKVSQTLRRHTQSQQSCGA
jgi:hypothetical protein